MTYETIFIIWLYYINEIIFIIWYMIIFIRYLSYIWNNIYNLNLPNSSVKHYYTASICLNFYSWWVGKQGFKFGHVPIKINSKWIFCLIILILWWEKTKLIKTQPAWRIFSWGRNIKERERATHILSIMINSPC